NNDNNGCKSRDLVKRTVHFISVLVHSDCGDPAHTLPGFGDFTGVISYRHSPAQTLSVFCNFTGVSSYRRDLGPEPRHVITYLIQRLHRDSHLRSLSGDDLPERVNLDIARLIIDLVFIKP